MVKSFVSSIFKPLYWPLSADRMKSHTRKSSEIAVIAASSIYFLRTGSPSTSDVVLLFSSMILITAFFVISRSSVVSVHGVPSSFEDVEVLLRRLRGLLGGQVHFYRVLNDGHDALLTLPHVMRDVAYHAQEGDHVLLVLPDGPCLLILELHLDVRREVLKYQVVSPKSVLDPGVLILFILFMYYHEQVEVEFPLSAVHKHSVELSVGEPVAGLDHRLTVRNLLLRPKLVVLPWWTYRTHKDRLCHVFHRLCGIRFPIHMPRSDVLCQLVEGILEPRCISRRPLREGYLFKS